MKSDTFEIIFGMALFAGALFGVFVLGATMVLNGHVRVELSATPFPVAK